MSCTVNWTVALVLCREQVSLVSMVMFLLFSSSASDLKINKAISSCCRTLVVAWC